MSARPDRSVLVTGTRSGLGAYLLERLGGVAFDRASLEPAHGPEEAPWRVIVHAAFASRLEEGQSEVDYRTANRALAERLLAQPHERFVFISSLDALAPSTPYGESKAEIEALVASKGGRPIVLRPASLFGPGMRPNGPLRVARGAAEPLTLAADSTFATTLYKDVADFVALGERGPERGDFDLVSRGRFSLLDVARAFDVEPRFGTYRYSVAESQNRRAEEWLPALTGDSLARFVRFARSE